MSKTDEKSGANYPEKSPFLSQTDSETEALDQYGVWVKSGPEPVEDEVFEIEESNQLKDLSETPSTDLTSEEEALLGNLESEEFESEEFTMEEAPMEDKSTTTKTETEQTGLEDIQVEEEELDLDFGELPDLDSTAEERQEKSEETSEKPADQSLEPVEGLEDFELEEEPFQVEEEVPSDTTLPTAKEEMESLTQEEPIIQIDEELPELELEEPASPPQETAEPIAEESLTEEPMMDEVPEVTQEPMDQAPMEEQGEEGMEKVEQTSLEKTEIEVQETPVQFNDVEAVSREMSSVPPSVPMDILTKIEEELAEIKNELAELKRELSSLRPSAPVQPAPEPAVEEEPKPAEGDGGFFEEDEDETIALTGDELDNILNTADITEEAGEPSVVPEDFDLQPAPGNDGSEGMIPVTTAEEQAIIEEYNKELDSFSSEEISFEAEDQIDQQAVEALPEEAVAEEELFEVEEKPKVESFVMEKPAPESVPSLTDIVENEASTESASQEPIFEETLAEAPEEGVVEIDLETMEETEEPAAEAVEETPVEEISEAAPEEEAEEAAFEEELEEMEISIPEEEPPVVPLEEPTPDLHIPQEAAEPNTPAAIPEPKEPSPPRPSFTSGMPESLREEIKAVLKYMDQLLEALPEEKIQEFARSEHFDVYRRLFEELGLE